MQSRSKLTYLSWLSLDSILFYYFFFLLYLFMCLFRRRPIWTLLLFHSFSRLFFYLHLNYDFHLLHNYHRLLHCTYLHIWVVEVVVKWLSRALYCGILSLQRKEILDIQFEVHLRRNRKSRTFQKKRFEHEKIL